MAGFDPYWVRQSTAYIWPIKDKARVKPDAEDDGVTMPVNYELYDDDDTNLPAYPSMDCNWAGKFKAAYIKIDYLSTSYQDEVTFLRHLDSGHVDDGSGDWNEDHDILPTDDFWTVMVCTAFQPQREKDGDPDLETPRTCGAARWSSGAWKNECAIYLEVIREVATLEVGHTMVHEIGHTGGADDQPSQEGCIMWINPASGLPGDNFCGMCLREFREDPVY